MLIHDLSAEECGRVLTAAEVGHLACANQGQPYVVPIHIAFDAERHCVYCVSAIGQKVEWMRANPRVCLAVDHITDKNHWRTVVISGTYEELRGAADADDAERRCLRLFERRPEWWLPAMGGRLARDYRGVVLFRIRIERMTGRRATRDLGSG
jgi:nitroimidazol reductase NimA-like FMN-containing flavoprotein (pyridoxamine 5'-phosphate oxidase superfamily)